MKFFLKRLYHNNMNYYKVWDYLWVMSNTKHEIIFSYNSLGGKLNISKSTLTRALKIHKDLNKEKQYIEITKLDNNQYLLKFYPNGKLIKKSNNSNNELYMFLCNFYKEHDIHYPELVKHKSYIDKIYKKISNVMLSKKVDINDDNIKQTFKIFFNNLPIWWRENQFTLPVLNKNFTKVINQIKGKNKKQIKYQQTSKDVENLKFK